MENETEFVSLEREGDNPMEIRENLAIALYFYNLDGGRIHNVEYILNTWESLDQEDRDYYRYIADKVLITYTSIKTNR